MTAVEEKRPSAKAAVSAWTAGAFFTGSPEAGMSRPMGLTPAGDKTLVADTGNGRILILDRQGKISKTITEIGNRRLMYPAAVAAMDKETVIIGDLYRGEVAAVSYNGEERFSLPLAADKSKVGAIRPTAIAVSQNRIFVTEVEGHRVLVFDGQGRFIRAFGRPGDKPGELSFPNGIAMDPAEKLVYVADSNNRRIQLFDLEGKFVKVLNLRDLKPLMPRGLVVDSRDRALYFADTLDHKVFRYDLDTKKISLVNKATALSFPNAVSVDDTGRLLVADRENNRVVVFSRK
jgi:sugar lactone lactonase YvrE